MKESSGSLIGRMRAAQAKRKSAKESDTDSKKSVKDDTSDSRPESELTEDEIAARELLKGSHQTLDCSEFDVHFSEAQGEGSDSSVDKTIPLPGSTDEVEPPPQGEKQSTLEDYESVPVNEFGKAMLRGMGWSDGGGIGKNPK